RAGFDSASKPSVLASQRGSGGGNLANGHGHGDFIPGRGRIRAARSGRLDRTPRRPEPIGFGAQRLAGKTGNERDVRAFGQFPWRNGWRGGHGFHDRQQRVAGESRGEKRGAELPGVVLEDRIGIADDDRRDVARASPESQMQAVVFAQSNFADEERGTVL